MRTVVRIVIVILLAELGLGTAGGQTLTTLCLFASATNGAYPQATLVQGTDGNFYGTTNQGGTNNGGTIFKITSQGTLTTLWQFGSGPTDALNPLDGLMQASDGNFYGITMGGGTNSSGTVFRITPQGTLTTLGRFVDNANGYGPSGVLVQGNDGNFYGTTDFGGTNNDGTVFRITPQGTLTTLWQFNLADGYGPSGGLLLGGDGNFYGTTYYGGFTNSQSRSGYGTVFRFTSQGTLTTLWQFHGTDGSNPNAAPVLGTDGNFYGTTLLGGTHGSGTVFRITSQGTLTTLGEFGTDNTNGSQPRAGLVQGSDGNFYGTTSFGGTNRWGTVFKITPQGTLTTLWQFNLTDGSIPYRAGLMQGSDGSFYGTTRQGGLTNCSGGCGTVFKLFVPLNPPANQISAVQIAGSDVALSIPSVAGETYQLQFSPDLSSDSWSNIPGASVTNSIGAMLTLTNFGGASSPQGFYRFSITP